MSHDVFVSQQLTEGIEAACAKAKRIINKDEYDELILQKMDPEEVVDARAKAADIREVIAPSDITGWRDLKEKVARSLLDIDYHLGHKKNLP